MWEGKRSKRKRQSHKGVKHDFKIRYFSGCCRAY